MSKLPVPKNKQEALELLGIDDEQPTERDINKAYRKLSLIYHPDKGGSNDGMKVLNKAKELLIDEPQRPKEQRKKQGSERQRREEEQHKKQESERQHREEEQRKRQESERQRKRGEISFELIEALKCRNLKVAKELIKEVKCFNTGLSGEFVYRFTCNACKGDDWFEFFQEFLLDGEGRGIDLDAEYVPGLIGTALNYACFRGSQNVVKLLLEHKANVNKASHANGVPIQFATAKGNIEIVRLLLEKGADPYLGNPNAVQIATQANSTELVSLFDQHLNSKLSQAFKSQDLTTVKELVKKVKGFSTCFNIDSTLLGRLVKNACESDDWFELFQEVLSEKNSKIDLNIDIDSNGTALHYACNQKSKNVIELLLKHKANFDKAGGHYNKPPIYSLLMSDNHELAGLLCKRGATTISIIPELEEEISANSWYDKYTKETIKVIVEGADREHRTRILGCFLNNKTLTDKDIEIIQLLLKYQNVDPNLDLTQSAINKGKDNDNEKLIGLFNQILDRRLSEHLIYERFQKARELIGKLEDFNKCKIENHDLGHSDSVLLLRYLVEKACGDDIWFEFFQEVLSEENSKIDLNIDIDSNGTALHYARNQKSKNVIELLRKHEANFDKAGGSDNKSPIQVTERVEQMDDRQVPLSQDNSRLAGDQQEQLGSGGEEPDGFNKEDDRQTEQPGLTGTQAPVVNGDVNQQVKTEKNNNKQQRGSSKQGINVPKQSTVQQPVNNGTEILHPIDNSPNGDDNSAPKISVLKQEGNTKGDSKQSSNPAVPQNTKRSKLPIITVPIGLLLGLSIAYLAGAAALTPAIAAVAVFIASAVVGALLGYGIGKLCREVSSQFSDVSTTNPGQQRI